MTLGSSMAAMMRIFFVHFGQIETSMLKTLFRNLAQEMRFDSFGGLSAAAPSAIAIDGAGVDFLGTTSFLCL